MRPLPPQAAAAAILSFALAACGAAPRPQVPARPKAAQAIAARTVVPMIARGELADATGLTRTFTLPEGGEVLADLRIAVPGGDWEVPGHEAATLRLVLDGAPNQDLVLHQGERPHTYQIALGTLAAGEHTLTLERLASHSAAGLTRVDLLGGSLGVVPPGAPGYEVLARSPILIGRASSHLTDTPLLMMVDEQVRPAGGTVTRYTAIFSNEDGGTATKALMARWGRTTDIDWCYAREVDGAGKTAGETYQARFHLTRAFRGKYEGQHPILRVATENNCYDDEGDGPLRFRLPPLFRLDPVQTAREEVLDRHPWAYALMAKELYRERKAAKDPGPAAAGGDLIGDPRRFLYVEFKQSYRGRGVGVAVTLKGQPDPIFSHRGDAGLTAKRTGWCRVAVELPARASLADVAAIDLVGPGRGEAIVTQVRRVLTLDDAYQPVIWPVTWAGDGTLKDDEDRVRVYEAPLSPVQPAPLEP
jgi:hypothetical protein